MCPLSAREADAARPRGPSAPDPHRGVHGLDGLKGLLVVAHLLHALALQVTTAHLLQEPAVGPAHPRQQRQRLLGGQEHCRGRARASRPSGGQEPGLAWPAGLLRKGSLGARRQSPPKQQRPIQPHCPLIERVASPGLPTLSTPNPPSRAAATGLQAGTGVCVCGDPLPGCPQLRVLPTLLAVAKAQQGGQGHAAGQPEAPDVRHGEPAPGMRARPDPHG